MSIPALTGGANQALQRALREAAERTLADEQALLDGEDPALASAVARGASAMNARQLRRRAAGRPAEQPEQPAQPQDEAIVVELGDGKADRLEVAGGWITTPRRSLETGTPPESLDADRLKGGPQAGSGAQGGPPAARTASQPAPGGAQPTAARSGTAQAGTAPTAGPTYGPTSAPATTAPAQGDAHGVSLDRLILVLKQTGIGFRDAYQVLREINAGAPLPPKAQLQARWAAADPAAWEARARTEQPARPEASTAPRPEPQPAPRTADGDLRQTPVDDLIRDRSWHRDRARPDHSDGSGTGLSVRDDRADARPTLQTIVRDDATNQDYIAGLSTAEFQRLVTVLGGTAPAWFWGLRGHRGLRGWAERPTVAKLNTARFAGTRLGAWLLAAAGTGALWAVGTQTGSWW